MGQVTSASHALKNEVSTIQEKVIVLNEVAFLSYVELLESIKQLNEITRSFTDRAGKQLCFSIKTGTANTIIWKTTVRIRCLKVNTTNNSIESSRLLKIHEFVAMRKEILNQVPAISTFSHNTTAEPSESVPSTSHNDEFIVSTYFSKDDTVEYSQQNEELNECCVCMDNKACIMLACSHEFCEKCIDSWTRDKRHSNCPLCRSRVRGIDDTWVLTEKCDTGDYENEVKGYLVGLADRKT